MRRQFVRLALCLFLLGGSVAYAQSGMTDNQVIEYVQQALQQGKDQQTIAMELLAKGATQEQLLRLKSQYSGATGASPQAAVLWREKTARCWARIRGHGKPLQTVRKRMRRNSWR